MRPDSAADMEASFFARRFPVLLFFGMWRAIEGVSSGVRIAGLSDRRVSPVCQ